MFEIKHKIKTSIKQSTKILQVHWHISMCAPK